MISQRDAFFNKLYELAQKDRDIIVITADMGAPALDQWRENLPDQFINVGIAEQTMITVAAGLALGGKKPYCFAIIPFITGRCYDQIKTCICMMNLPVTLVGVGAGLSYNDSGPTHHGIDDVAVMRILPNMQIWCPYDTATAISAAQYSVNKGNITQGIWRRMKPLYIRLDRQPLPDYKFKDIGIDNGQPLVIAMGNMVHAATRHASNVIALCSLRPEPVDFGVIKFFGRVITVEEHLLNGGLGSIVAEYMADHNINIPLKRIGVPDIFLYKYGDREDIWDGEAELRQILAQYRTKVRGSEEDNRGKTSGNYPARSKRRGAKAKTD